MSSVPPHGPKRCLFAARRLELILPPNCMVQTRRPALRRSVLRRAVRLSPWAADLPFEYLLRGLQQAVDAELNHEFSERLIGAIVHRSQPYLLDSEKDCQADARTAPRGAEREGSVRHVAPCLAA